jgi:amidase
MPVDPFTTASAMVRLLAAGDVSSRDLVELHLERIERLDGALNAVVTVDAGGARQAADAVDRARGGGRPVGPLHGLPVTLKDCWATAGLRTTAGQPDMADHVPAGDAVAVDRLRRAGAVVVGKTNLPAGVTGQETANEVFGRTCNPWDPARTPGGSSGGAAAAVAAGLSPLDLGSDSGGSVRQPAHFCGVFGHFPTHGIVPLRGHLPSHAVEDVGRGVDLTAAGPLARSAEDLALALGVVAGPDEPDAAAVRIALPPPAVTSAEGLRVALWLGDADLTVAAEVGAPIERAVRTLAAAGAEVVERGPAFSTAEACEVAFLLWVSSTASSTSDDDHERLVREAAGVRPEPGADLTALRAAGQAIRHRDWQRLDARRRELNRAWAALFDDVDVVVCPVAPVAALPHDPEPGLVDDVDHRLSLTIDVDGEPRPYLEQILWNTVVGMASLPSTVAPVGRTPGGLPVGAQVVGRPYADLTTIAVAGLLGRYERPPGFS